MAQLQRLSRDATAARRRRGSHPLLCCHHQLNCPRLSVRTEHLNSQKLDLHPSCGEPAVPWTTARPTGLTPGPCHHSLFVWFCLQAGRKQLQLAAIQRCPEWTPCEASQQPRRLLARFGESYGLQQEDAAVQRCLRFRAQLPPAAAQCVRVTAPTFADCRGLCLPCSALCVFPSGAHTSPKGGQRERGPTGPPLAPPPPAGARSGCAGAVQCTVPHAGPVHAHPGVGCAAPPQFQCHLHQRGSAAVQLDGGNKPAWRRLAGGDMCG